MKTQKIMELTRSLRYLYNFDFRDNYGSDYHKGDSPYDAYYVEIIGYKEDKNIVTTKDHVHNLCEDLRNAVCPVILKYIELIEQELKNIVTEED